MDTGINRHGHLHIYNTLTRQKERFETIEPGKVGMYVCGVTVYDHAHIGHGMGSIVFDTIRRYLMHLGYDVRYAQNFTDIDDKIIDRAQREDIDPFTLTEQLISEWTREIDDLNILSATVTPRATQEIPGIITMIEGLIERDHAYVADGDVYFRVRSFPDYGKLSGRNIDDLVAGSRVDVLENKADPLDFAVWKAAKPGEPSWESPWGRGRPGWHIECSAMCTHHLNGVVDVHGGGRDLIFPHHENEIAQSEAYSGTAPFARYWLHNGMLRLDGEKMSKSLGNVVWLGDLITRDRAAAFRLQVLQTHYRSPLNYTEAGLDAAAAGLDRLIAAARIEAEPNPNATAPDLAVELAAQVDATDRSFHEGMNDDFDTPVAIAALFELARAINRFRAQAGATDVFHRAQDTLRTLAGVLGLDLSPRDTGFSGEASPFIELLIDIRAHLREQRQWAAADLVRDGLAERGIALEDSASGTTWKRADT
ncbi:MAG TPA: cysteine--tRNA ligase [Thermomicrobiales bacterium]|nr:cysteine--tRNA ligase [Thermomicrobiales bacterium]